MNTDDIEKNLNNYEVNTDRTIAIILTTVAKNQAILETLLDLQLTILTKGKEPDFSDLSKYVSKTVDEKLSLIQANISSRFR